MPPILDLIILLFGLLLFLVLRPSPQKVSRALIGSTVIVKTRTRNIHIGVCEMIDEGFAICFNSAGHMFIAEVKKLFWNEGEQAFVEKV